jgi:hypothetical protein
MQVTGITAAGVTTTGTVQPGVRGDGIQSGDILKFIAVRGQGISVASTALFPPTGTSIPSGTSTFTMPNGFPAWVVPGMTVQSAAGTSIFVGGTTTVASVSGNTLNTVAALSTTISGNEQQYFAIYTTGLNTNPSNTVGPNNVLVGTQALSPSSFADCGFSVAPQPTTQFINVTGNYFNDCSSSSRDIEDFGLSGGNTTTPNNYFAQGSVPTASIEYYDATLQGNSFTGSYVVNANGGATLTTTGGNPAVGDSIFGAGIPGGTYVVSGSAGSFLIANRYGALVSNVGSITMTSGSVSHFLAQADLLSKDNWNLAYTANMANNFIRTMIGCTPSSTPACYQQQNFLLKRDLDPASNDNDPMWLEKAA